MEKQGVLDLIKIEDSETVPKYRQLQSEIERLIAENFITANTRLPGENEFLNRLGLSRTTIRNALSALEEAHLIYRMQGQGTFVGSKPPFFSENGKIIKSDKAKQVIGLVTPNITNEIYSFIIQGVEQTVQSRHICVFSANSGGRGEKELRIINEMLNNSIDGLILEPLYSEINENKSQLVSLLENLTIPVVLISNDIPTFECSKVMLDDEWGGHAVTRHFVEYGHKRIAYIYSDKINAALERRKGYRRALTEAGIPLDPELEIPYNDEQGLVYPGYILTEQLLQRPDLGVTAIFYFNDDLALQGLAATQNMNLEIPRDLSIAGYDDIPRSRLGGIRLTTVSHPKSLIGILAASLLLEQFEHTDMPIYRKVTVHSSMVYRNSVCKPK